MDNEPREAQLNTEPSPAMDLVLKSQLVPVAIRVSSSVMIIYRGHEMYLQEDELGYMLPCLEGVHWTRMEDAVAWARAWMHYRFDGEPIYTGRIADDEEMTCQT